MTAIVELESLSKDYHLGKSVVHALTDVSLTLAQGDFACLSGPSGSGKSTLLNIIGGLDVPTAGRIRIGGVDTSRFRDRRLTDFRAKQVGFVFQSFNLLPMLSTYENVDMGLVLSGRSHRRAERRSLIMDLLSRLGIAEYARHKPEELSGGQRQRVAIARALVKSPQIVLADEPTANLDTATGHQIMDLMESLNEREKVTFLISSHDPRVIAMTDRVIKLQDGEIIDEQS